VGAEKIMKYLGVFLCSIFLVLGSAASNSTEREFSYVPPLGFVPNSAVALDVARAVIVPIYGATNIKKQEPLSVYLDGDIWIVEGKLRKGIDGGVVRVHISKIDARVLHLSHGK
jgi:hypothetical protein